MDTFCNLLLGAIAFPPCLVTNPDMIESSTFAPTPNRCIRNKYGNVIVPHIIILDGTIKLGKP